MLTNAKKRNTVLIMTLKPSLERNLVEIIEAIEPNKIAPAIELNTISGIVTKLNLPVPKKTEYPIALFNLD